MLIEFLSRKENLRQKPANCWNEGTHRVSMYANISLTNFIMLQEYYKIKILHKLDQERHKNLYVWI
jgi:hypothetical protein